MSDGLAMGQVIQIDEARTGLPARPAKPVGLRHLKVGNENLDGSGRLVGTL
ncbi:hypothetical protein [Bradyrhizobium sp. CCBAU 45389]|uniref:hypothetical protein n=1 Tax=Bradyrhizobium sp. CCBAU 45389 TaxID=858429 RepID=UPI00230509D9|nr:hypothetical protein [Bradyrhizobium sp. CCBAU 45389]